MPTKDEIIQKLDEIEWNYAPQDLNAARQMAERIARTGRLGGSLISYSNLVEGIQFDIPSVNGGTPFLIDTHNWSDLHRGILGDFLGFLSSASFRAGGFMASCLVVSLKEYQPSDVYFNWMRDLDILPSKSEDALLKYWSAEVTIAVNWYKANPQGFDL